MNSLKARITAGCILILMLVGVGSYEYFQSRQSMPVVESPGSELPPAQSAPIAKKVYISGAVSNPGIYNITGKEERVSNLITRAGGFTSEADTAAVNMAAKLKDGMHVKVPCIKKPAMKSPATSVPTGLSSAPAVNSSVPSLVNINKAGPEELDALPGIGRALAMRIIEYRKQHGPFGTPEDLKKVPGIGEAKYRELASHICI